MICAADFMLVNCRGVQQCTRARGTEKNNKNKVWLISTFTGWLESEELCVFSISSRSRSESYHTEACYTLLSGNGIMALLVDLKWSPLHPPVFVWHLDVCPMVPPSHHDAPVATNQFPTLSNELRFCIFLLRWCASILPPPANRNHALSPILRFKINDNGCQSPVKTFVLSNFIDLIQGPF